MDHEMEFDRAYRQYAGLIYRYFSYMFHELYTIGSTTPSSQGSCSRTALFTASTMKPVGIPPAGES